VRLVVEIEEDGAVSVKGGCHGAREDRRMGSVGEALLGECALVSGCVPVEIDDHVEAGVVQPLHVCEDGLPIRSGAVLRLHLRQPEPTRLVHRQPDRIDMPGLHGCDRRLVDRSLPQPPTLRAGVLEARPIDPKEPNRVPIAVDEPIALDPDREPARGRAGACKKLHDKDEAEEFHGPSDHSLGPTPFCHASNNGESLKSSSTQRT
jgi:hypothetical protein